MSVTRSRLATATALAQSKAPAAVSSHNSAYSEQLNSDDEHLAQSQEHSQVSEDPLLLEGSQSAPDVEMSEGDEEIDEDDEVVSDTPDSEEEEDEEEEDEDEYDDSEDEAIRAEMAALLDTVPVLQEQYQLVDRLGEGTFSSVYKAIDLQFSKYDNSFWATRRALEKPGTVYVALKRIYVTSSPVRIFNELDILNDLRGATNVAYLISAIRHEDQVIAVMPFNRHQDFRTYYRHATLPQLRSYFASLFRALASTHKLSIIHRDVKPANFLYDTTTGTGVLCDYGLAEKIGGNEWCEWKAECCHSLPAPSWGGLAGRATSAGHLSRLSRGQSPGLAAGLHGCYLPAPVSLLEQAMQQEKEWEEIFEDWEAQSPQERCSIPELLVKKPWLVRGAAKDELKARFREQQTFYKSWRSVDSNTPPRSARVGYIADDMDRRSSVRANRAGTRGFRAPEVLLKCPDQTVALDIWSAGIILLCLLTRRFPFFNSNDDTEALAEITAIFGKRKLEKCAALHNRTFQTNIPDFDPPRHPNLHALVKSLCPSIIVHNSTDPYGPIPSSTSSDKTWYQGSELFQAVDLMKRCLELDLTKRWTAEELLEHPFFDGEFDLGKDGVGERQERHF